jgi:hypothetical protein
MKKKLCVRPNDKMFGVFDVLEFYDDVLGQTRGSAPTVNVMLWYGV